MFKDFRLWIIVALVIIIIVMVVTRPKPIPEFIEGKLEYAERMKEHVKPYDSAQIVIDSLILKGKLDSIRSAEREKKYQRDNACLQSKLKALDFSKSTDKQLDSLISVLYDE